MRPSIEGLDLDFLPDSLVRQCFYVIEKYHALHGFRCLPDILWRTGLGPFIKRNDAFSKLFTRASRARRAKEASEHFARIATAILALEILASSFVGWSSHFPEAAEKARAYLKKHGASLQTPLMD